MLENLKAATAFARDNPEEFYAMAAKNGEVEAKKLCKNAEREKEQITARITQLDNIIRCLYEDRSGVAYDKAEKTKTFGIL